MNLEHNPLPPRRSRHTRPKASFSFKKWIQPGLYLFGLVFFGLIGLELYRANVPHESAASGSVEVKDVSKASTTSQGSKAGEKEPVSVVLDATPDPSASVTTPPAKVKTIESKSIEPAVKAVTSVQTPAVSPVPAQTSTGTPVNKANQIASTSTSKVAIPGKQASTPPTTKSKVVKHVVKKGETLFMLSRKYYGNNSNVGRIAKYNRLHSEAGLVEGKIVWIPLLQ
ncbi:MULTISPECIES: LysM peptidoglycan-binding domain-containing protein [Brevibacillus]|uniref:Peptidoglycan-binding protein LysM n=1 Tax=Brevibacillus porteri TaxID=2126350 RepID=A0ABX5FP67_9BACL|nr:MULTISPECIES: LysM peptidoglycan-binding domain-containing protein [Brevibacillus]MDC0759892.1 LysM peptidoglycan-binding domain-containing protein [Brevibacillus sp. AG]MED1799168.1 LysM peptidoglycan-binding domain-containing protein [Brevibacillus porteri]MED2135230.1 LysM peptidoglycan-binding domain-containing protein [Brevibacillus porteri]MED2746759.1 LysM peptidoglycan-binding domain-containing protein [Brevibacillus porteri]MED2814971.1 LysM peptidoglycan-binding domain-containing 